MNILLFGASGRLGKALFPVLQKTHRAHYPDNVTAISHRECDVCDFEKTKKIIAHHHPDMVINATGYTKVDTAEEELEQAYALNEKAVLNLAQVCKLQQTTLVHFSTDYVFDGKKKSGYGEEDSPAPLSVYGASKAAGEKAVQETLKKYFLIRTAWPFGGGGKNFVDSIVEQAHEGKPLNVVNDQIGSPTYLPDLAEAVSPLLESKKYGIYHIVNEGSCSWYELAVEIFHQLGVPQKVNPISSRELNRPARRPHYSVLLNTKLPRLRHWKEALTEYLMNKTLIL